MALVLETSTFRRVWFTRSGKYVYLEGIWLGKDPEVLFESEICHVWYVPSCKRWSGLGFPWVDEPATYYLMRIEGDQALCLGQMQPGPFWKRGRKMLQEMMLAEVDGEHQGEN